MQWRKKKGLFISWYANRMNSPFHSPEMAEGKKLDSHRGAGLGLFVRIVDEVDAFIGHVEHFAHVCFQSHPHVQARARLVKDM